MATTPPLQMIPEAQTPSTPLHGARYDGDESPRIRSSTRLRQKRAAEEDSQLSTPAVKRQARQITTPNSPPVNPIFESHAPQSTPKQRTSRRVQVFSPSSPNTEHIAPQNSTSRSHSQPYLSSSTVLSDGMLPTPVKTPRKKQIAKSSLTGRALFQEPNLVEEMASPRKIRKPKRFNGFSLESFRAEDGRGQRQVEIFTDSRDQVPEADHSEDNPFLEDEVPHTPTTTRVTRTSKRRKTSETRTSRKDPQVEEAIRTDEGMVYVFRGKKVYRRFDDSGEEEEEIDAEDLGLLEYLAGGSGIARPLKTLTRKSIRPTRLFQTETQKRTRALEKEEEALTDIEESAGNEQGSAVDAAHSLTEDLVSEPTGRNVPLQGNVDSENKVVKAGKKSSPFDSWVRVKAGSASSSARDTRSRKRVRSASPIIEAQNV